MKQDSNEIKIFDWLDGILAAVILVLSLAFYLLLNAKTSSGFGFSEIVFSFMIAIFASLFLVWNKSLMIKNHYLGIIMGIVALVISIYAIYFRYHGPYTLTFSLISVAVILAYLGFTFFKYHSVISNDDIEE